MKGSLRFVLLAQLIVSISFLGCGGDDVEVEIPLYDIYAFGDQNNQGTVWLNETIQSQPLGRYLLNGCEVEKDFYVAGVGEGGIPVKAVAKYWKNGNEVALSDGTKTEWAYDVAVSGSDIYVAGYDEAATVRAKYWKNSSPVILGDNVNASGATDVAVPGSDFYISGWENVNNNDSIVARVWKNGVRIKVETNSRYYYVEGLAVIGGDLYLVGYESNGSGFSRAKYWKNGIGTYLDDDAIAVDIAMKDNDIYIVGTKSGKGGFWKNGEFTPFSDQKSECVSIAVYDNDIIVAGNYLDDSNRRSGIIWKNKEPLAPFLGTDQSIRLYGAVIMKR